MSEDAHILTGLHRQLRYDGEREVTDNPVTVRVETDAEKSLKAEIRDLKERLAEAYKSEEEERSARQASEAKCAEMMDALEKCRYALSSTCGRGWVMLDDPVVVGMANVLKSVKSAREVMGFSLYYSLGFGDAWPALAAYDALKDGKGDLKTNYEDKPTAV